MKLRLLGHFTGKGYFIRNGIQSYNPLHRKMRMHSKWHYILTTQLCLGGKNKIINVKTKQWLVAAV